MITHAVAFLLIGANAFCAEITLQNSPRIHSPLGYSLIFPPGYTGLRDARDNGTDTVVVHPQSYQVRFSDMGDLGLIKAHKLIVLNVYPNPRKTLQELATGALRRLKQQGRTFSSRKVSSGLGTAELIQITDGLGYVTVLVVGKKASYEFIAGAYERPLKTMLKNLTENSSSGASALSTSASAGNKSTSAEEVGSKLTFSKTLAWEKSPDQFIEFPHPDHFAVTFGVQGFEDSLLFMGAKNASIAIMPLGSASPQPLNAQVAEMARPLAGDPSCSLGPVEQGRLRNGWPAAWIAITCRKADGPMVFGRLIMTTGGKSYLVSGVKVPVEAVKSIAGRARLVTK